MTLTDTHTHTDTHTDSRAVDIDVLHTPDRGGIDPTVVSRRGANPDAARDISPDDVAGAIGEFRAAHPANRVQAGGSADVDDGPLTRTPSRPRGSFWGVVFLDGEHRPGMFGFLGPQ